MFMFMKQTMVEAQTSGSPPTGGVKGFDEEGPITLFGRGTDANGAPVGYHATLVMRPLQSAVSGMGQELLKKEKENKTTGRANLPQPTKSLKSLRQNPYFSTSLLRNPDAYDSRETQPGLSGLASRGRDSRRLGDRFYDDGEDYRYDFDSSDRRGKDMRHRLSARVSPVERGNSSSQELEIPDDEEATREVDFFVASVSIFMIMCPVHEAEIRPCSGSATRREDESTHTDRVSR